MEAPSALTIVSPVHARMSWLLKRAIHFSGVAAVTRLLRRGRFEGLRVINFHRIIPDEVSVGHYAPLMGEPTVCELRAVLIYLKRWFTFISPRDYVEAAASGRALAPYSLMLTFDDGYADLCERLLPILESIQVPAAVFVSTGAMAGDVLWFQKLFAAIIFTKLDCSPDGFNVPVRPTATLQERVATLDAYSQLQKRTDPESWEEQVGRICDAFRWDGDLHDQRLMTWSQLETLRRSPYVTVGGHSVSHPYLPLCDARRLQRELVECRDELADRLRVDFIPFSYPNGASDRRVIEAVRAANYDAAFVMAPGLNTTVSERYRLFRHYVSPNVAECSVDLAFRVPLTSPLRD